MPSINKIIVPIACLTIAIAAVVIGIAIYQQRAAQDARVALDRVTRENRSLQLRLDQGALEIRRADARAREAEDDNGRLLKLIDDLRSAVGSGITRSTPAAATGDFFASKLESARWLAARGEFSSAVRLFNEAMSLREPGELPADVAELRDALMKQNAPVEVTFESDGETTVRILPLHPLGKFDDTTARLLPGNYRVIGEREGYLPVSLSLEVRAGTQPPPVIAVKCTVQAN